jgi:hypothetical protein
VYIVDDHILALGDRVELRKKHPCGSVTWRVVRLGADVGLECLGCGRAILLPHSPLRKQMKKVTRNE